MDRNKALRVTEEVFGLYEKFGSADYIGEPVSQIEHMCQAAQLAEAEGYDDETVLAAFFHDIGHLCEHIMPAEQMSGYGVADHETLGAGYLRDKGFSEKITKLVASHVEAKRYLTFKYPEYYNKLSEASKKTLEMQGGIMTEAEAEKFEADDLHRLYIKLREWDDKAKLEHQPLPALEKYKQKTVEHLVNQAGIPC